MTDKQIERLKQFLVGNRIFWEPGDGMIEIISIGTIDNEPSECGIFFNKGYIALYNVDPKELWLCNQLFLST